MASETDFSPEPPTSFTEPLISTGNRGTPLFLTFISALNAVSPLQETQNQGSPRDGIILINPFTQDMVLIESSSSGRSSVGFDSFFNGKEGHPPASKASIDALETVEIDKGGDQCVICLDEWEIGEKAKEMPCKHRFHGVCVEKWLKIHGSCPVCRYEMPVEDENADGKMRDGERGRGVWLGFAFSSERDESSELLPSDQQLQQG
ncbi:hypothetical protein OROGR_001370 [Orobanche gracilis]